MIRFEEFERLGVAVAAMSDKADGDCGLRNAADPAAALRARARVCRACGVNPGDLVAARQVHGTCIVHVGEPDRGKGATSFDTALDATDGMATGASVLPLAVFVADCVPVYLYERRRHVAAIIHAGRRGTFRNISGRAVQFLKAQFQANGADVHALIGPAAGPCCYEVSVEQAQAFDRAGLPVRGRYIDLWEANARQLSAAGVPRAQIAIAGLCTVCGDRFYSYRADADARRSMAFLML